LPRGAGDVALARDLLERSGLAKDGVASAQLLSALIDLQQENYAIAAVTLDRLYSRQPDNRRIRDLLAFALSRSAGERELVRRFAGIVADDPASAYLRTLVGPRLRGAGRPRPRCAVPRSAGDCIGPADRAAEPFAGTDCADVASDRGTAAQGSGAPCHHRGRR
jgi:predicted Zn-dependent protease